MTKYLVNIHYGSLAFSQALLHNVFLLYHVELFVTVYQIDQVSFWCVEIIFLFWNSINDPLIGWITDREALIHSSNVPSIVPRRLDLMSKIGPLLCLSFCLMWFSWNWPAMQFLVCLCAYDGFLTFVDVQHSALMADLAITEKDRTDLNFASSAFSAIASVSVFSSYYFWNGQSLNHFFVFCLVLSIISSLGFMISSSQLKLLIVDENKHHLRKSQLSNFTYCSKKPLVKYPKTSSSMKFFSDFLNNKNFMAFAAINLVQVFHCHFNSNFFPLFLETLLGDSVPQWACSAILGVSFVMPHINNLFFLTLSKVHGVYAIIRGLFLLKLLLSVIMLFVGRSHIILLIIFIASNRVFTEGTCKLLSLIVGDMVDEDFVMQSRPQAVSALMFGSANFLAKPGQTMAPLVGTWLITQVSGHNLFQVDRNLSGLKANLQQLSSEQLHDYKESIFQVLVLIPIICASIQLGVWSLFSLHGQRLSWIKSIRTGRHCQMI